jgi:hypothetical protein
MSYPTRFQERIAAYPIAYQKWRSLPGDENLTFVFKQIYAIRARMAKMFWLKGSDHIYYLLRDELDKFRARCLPLIEPYTRVHPFLSVSHKKQLKEMKALMVDSVNKLNKFKVFYGKK